MVNIAKLFRYQNAAMLLKYCQVSIEVFGQGNFLTERFVAIRCVNVICTDKNGSGKTTY